MHAQPISGPEIRNGFFFSSSGGGSSSGVSSSNGVNYRRVRLRSERKTANDAAAAAA